MCRHLAYLGPARSLGDLLLTPEHGLLTQSYAPRRQRNGLMNADGWGVGFYADARPDEPARWRSNRPLWADPSFASVAPVISAGCVLAAVRSATAGMPADETAAAPFQSGRQPAHEGRLHRRRAQRAADAIPNGAFFPRQMARVFRKKIDLHPGRASVLPAGS